MSKMLAEIRQQPETLERTLIGGRKTAEKLRRHFAQHRPRMIVLAARGTSDNAAQFGRYLLEITTGIPVSLAAPSIFTLYESGLDYRDVLVVAISQSGESTDTNVVLDKAKGMGAFTIGITNEAASNMAKLADCALLVKAGKERSVAATKTYTGQLMMFYLLAWALGGAIQDDDLPRIPEWARQALRLESEMRERAERYTFMNHAVVVGRGLNYANAFEFALKLMETCYVVAERFSSADLLHGPIAMVNQAFPVFVFAPAGVTWPGIYETLGKLEGIKAETVILTDKSNEHAASRERAIVLPMPLSKGSLRPAELYTPIPYIIPAQLFAATLAVAKGLNPDAPRTLQKVTQTL
jgi:glucosamine--fructose-6-phosphate aminotransferase (isomerizing)